MGRFSEDPLWLDTPARLAVERMRDRRPIEDAYRRLNARRVALIARKYVDDGGRLTDALEAELSDLQRRVDAVEDALFPGRRERQQSLEDELEDEEGGANERGRRHSGTYARGG